MSPAHWWVSRCLPMALAITPISSLSAHPYTNILPLPCPPTVQAPLSTLPQSTFALSYQLTHTLIHPLPLPCPPSASPVVHPPSEHIRLVLPATILSLPTATTTTAAALSTAAVQSTLSATITGLSYLINEINHTSTPTNLPPPTPINHHHQLSYPLKHQLTSPHPSQSSSPTNPLSQPLSQPPSTRFLCTSLRTLKHRDKG